MTCFSRTPKSALAGSSEDLTGSESPLQLGYAEIGVKSGDTCIFVWRYDSSMAEFSKNRKSTINFHFIL